MSAHRRTFRLPFGLSVEFIETPVGGYRVEWQPGIPTFDSARARRRFDAAYIAARDTFAKELVTVTGKAIGVVDLGRPNDLRVFEPATRH